jgi:hypothetical protein
MLSSESWTGAWYRGFKGLVCSSGSVAFRLCQTCEPSKERILAHQRSLYCRSMHGIILEDNICGGHQGTPSDYHMQVLVRHVHVTTELVLRKEIRKHVESICGLPYAAWKLYCCIEQRIELSVGRCRCGWDRCRSWRDYLRKCSHLRKEHLMVYHYVQVMIILDRKLYSSAI